MKKRFVAFMMAVAMTATVASPVVPVTQAAEDDFLNYVEGGEIFVNNVPEFGQESTGIFKDTVSLNKEVFTRYTFTLTQPSYVQIGYEQYNSTSSWGVILKNDKYFLKFYKRYGISELFMVNYRHDFIRKEFMP